MKRVTGILTPPVLLDPRSRVPFHRQIYEWFHRAIVSGQLQPGQRIPSSRTLALDLAVSRIPVLQAFEQLKAEGYLEGIVGAGTRVSRTIPQESIEGWQQLSRTRRHRRRARRRARPGLVPKGALWEAWLGLRGAFRAHLPAFEQFPVEIWSQLVFRHARRRGEELMRYDEQLGHRPLREVLTHYLRTVRALRCEPEQLMIVSGSQQGLYLCASVLVNRGEPVWIEEPGYPGAHQAFAAGRNRMVAVPVDAEGIDVAAGERRCARARLAYVTPAHQYPLGATMSLARRLQLLTWASKCGAWVVEDDYDSEFRQGLRPVAALQSLDEDARVLYVGTFSKSLHPALRLGYVVVPKDLVEAFAVARDAIDICPPTLLQAALADFIREGHFARHIRRMRLLYTDRCRTLVAALRVEFGERLTIVNGETGMHLVVLLPEGLSDTRVSQLAAEQGVSAMPLSRCCLRAPRSGGLVLGYGTVSTAQIPEGVRRLKTALDRATGQAPRSSLRSRHLSSASS
jgi:GntR family transcriptional regulator / MocR family aminotransferase